MNRTYFKSCPAKIDDGLMRSHVSMKTQSTEISIQSCAAFITQVSITFRNSGNKQSNNPFVGERINNSPLESINHFIYTRYNESINDNENDYPN